MNGTDDFFAKASADLAPQRGDVCVQSIGVGKASVIPDVFQEGQAAEYAVAVKSQKLQQLELFFGQPDLPVFKTDLKIIGIDIQPAEAEYGLIAHIFTIND